MRKGSATVAFAVFLVFSFADRDYCAFGMRMVEPPKWENMSRSCSVTPCQDAQVDNDPVMERRGLFATAFATSSLLLLAVTPAEAVKPRNAALCDTGLFDNLMEYRCTPLGNIEDEGTSRNLSEKEESAADSLMSKLFDSSVRVKDDPIKIDGTGLNSERSGLSKLLEKDK